MMRKKGGLWPPQESGYLGGGGGGVPRMERSEPQSTYKAMHQQGGAHTRRRIHKALGTEGGLWPPYQSCLLGGVRGCPPHQA